MGVLGIVDIVTGISVEGGVGVIVVGVVIVGVRGDTGDTGIGIGSVADLPLGVSCVVILGSGGRGSVSALLPRFLRLGRRPRKFFDFAGVGEEGSVGDSDVRFELE